jgi:hypothetical protein
VIPSTKTSDVKSLLFYSDIDFALFRAESESEKNYQDSLKKRVFVNVNYDEVSKCNTTNLSNLEILKSRVELSNQILRRKTDLSDGINR